MRITKYIVGGLAALALVGCKDKMRELNTNVNTMGKTDPRYMFMDAMQDFEYSTRAVMENTFGSAGTMMQYFVHYQGATNGTYCNSAALEFVSPSTISYQYDMFYGVGYKMVSIQNYLNDVLEEAQRPQYEDLRAITGIVKVYEGFRVFQNYGAAVYNQAFEAITEQITLPEYDIFTLEIYKELDKELAGYIAVLEKENEDQVSLGEYDPVYGYSMPSKAATAPDVVTDGAIQRARWKKFANSYRLYMAWIMKKAPGMGDYFNQVLAETKASGWFESAADGAFAYMNSGAQNSSIYNNSGPNAISTNYSVTDNFVSYLKELNDPRLPLLARANSLYADNKAVKWMQAYFPDSLQKHWIYKKSGTGASASGTWVQESWGDVLDFNADPMMAYQGQTANPEYFEQGGPGEFWGQRTFTFRFFHPNYNPRDPESNKKLGPWTVTNKGTVSDDFPASFTIKGADTSFTLTLASRPQGRYFTSCGGRAFADGTENWANGYDGSTLNYAALFYHRPVYTYPEFCFMMAYLTVDGASTGKTADEWYEAGVRGAMAELQNDALCYQIQVATSNNTTTTENNATVVTNPRIEGVNEDGVYSITGLIDTYVTAQALSNAADKKEAIVGQMWIYAYNQPTKMWDWWRLTGYPKIVEVKTPADRPTGLYWVKPAMRDSGNPLEFPRRGALPQPKAANNVNYNAARDALLKEANYGTMYNETTGRIFWDVQGL